MKRFALAGNPNSGKTTLFNSLTGSSEYVGNWPGVTVEKKIGTYKNKKTGESASPSWTCRGSILSVLIPQKKWCRGTTSSMKSPMG
jgi:ribosome-binding ATPase YchF (GTP1/OBG family)